MHIAFAFLAGPRGVNERGDFNFLVCFTHSQKKVIIISVGLLIYKTMSNIPKLAVVYYSFQIQFNILFIYNI
jgi:hypothetical protein